MRRMSLLFCAVAAGYAGGSWLSWSWFGADGVGASFFPAAGITLGTMALMDRRRWPVILAAAFTAEVLVNLSHGMATAPAFGYGVANTAQPLVGALVFARAAPLPPNIARSRDLAGFLAGGVLAGPLVGGLLGAATNTWLGSGDGFARFAWEWWVGDGLGVLVVGGGILSWRAASGHPRTTRRIAETAALTLAAAGATAASFWFGVAALGYVSLVALMAAGFRVGTRGVALAGTAVAFIAAQALASGHSAFDIVEISSGDALVYFQLALAVLVATAYAVAAEVGERERAAGERRAAERFQALADRAPAMLWVTDRDGRCTYLSRGWYEFTGQAVDEGLGSGWLGAIHPADAEGVELALTHATAHREPFRADYRLRRTDDVYRRVIDSARPVLGRDGEFAGMVGSVIDVHERIEAEDALRSSDARFRALFEAIDEGYCLCEMVLDEAGAPVDYRFLEANHHVAAMTGLHDAAGRNALEMVPGLERHWLDTYARVALGDETLRFEEGSDAMGRWFDVFATPVEPRGRFALVFKDITEQRRAELALRESELEARRARRRAEFLAEVIGEMEAVDGVTARAERLMDLLVPRVADRASLVVPGNPPTVLAHRSAPGERDPAHSELRTSMETGERPEAALALELTNPDRRPYGDRDREFFAGLTARAGVLLASARVHQEEHRVALSLQRALLPNVLEVHPDIDVAARYAAATGALEVGGDWYDVFLLPDGRIGLAVGDVVGHGLESAATMGRLRTALAALAPHAAGPGELLSHLQQFTDGPNGTGFATACYAVLDPGAGELVHASAGHPPCLVVDPGGATRWLEDGRSVPLCSLGGTDRPQAVTALEPGSLLVLFTDGLVERRGASLSAGMEWLAAVAGELSDAPVEEICDRVLAEMVGDAERADDLVIVCVRYAPVPADALRRSFPAEPGELRNIRTAARTWLEEHGVEEPHRTRLLVGLGEACSNVVRHAYPDGAPGMVDVHLDAAPDGRVRVRVTDGGSWKEPGSGAPGGYGIRVIRGLNDAVTFRTGDAGTTVGFELAVPAPLA
ncbi:MAG: SpoIIE family protein phosphatase [Thermoleophilia bacterium]|nr:SpoIIE family protein phosphatase [Thermoleophilia bacterium]